MLSDLKPIAEIDRPSVEQFQRDICFKAQSAVIRDIAGDWTAMFDHFVFGEGAHAMDHMPMQMRGGLGPVSPQMRQGLWHGIARGIAPHLGPPPGTEPK